MSEENKNTNDAGENLLAEKKVESLEEYVNITYMGAKDSKFQKTEGGLLSLEFNGKVYERVSINRAFPFSLTDEYICVKDKDGKEIGIIKSLLDVDEKTQAIIKEELQWVYFCPEIKRIIWIKEEFGYSYWNVETDRGVKRFTVRGTNECVVPVTETQVLITDMDGNRYEIADIRELDQKSFKLIDSLI